ncbi:hypothetical protein NC796_03825 [Aliifodinibius sp. S!AR15-10]|uniref:hypothetical protein n=1 Tax=Aliifodinibius sp. S!AR15-10 TaxID=2950437 RepID=UPI002856C026|nr:hypothetical protein [Aliifodinibius sp. S!AR15-10]MDR8390255.1 hypothetical protein [Aliifodinibius sp. S!AR15-10]
MKKDKSINVIYIAGNGHSGSTLLDIILGSNDECFSAGELKAITRDTIMQEYCSCKKIISDCEVWSEVIQLWQANCEVDYQQYQNLRLRFERNKSTLRTLFNRMWPSNDFDKYCEATLQLFQALRKVTGKSVIIDSSKSPQRIAVLSRIVDLRVIHLCRDFTGVLNSAKKSSSKDIKAGIEKDNPASRTWKVVVDWIVTNIATEIFCIGVNSSKVFYKNYVHNPESLRGIHPLMDQINGKESFSTSHMLAGNIIRLKKDLKINPNVGFQYKRLNNNQRALAKVMDKLFAYWT